jgi:branched-chain amino acid transport system ATP-binding protein
LRPFPTCCARSGGQTHERSPRDPTGQQSFRRIPRAGGRQHRRCIRRARLRHRAERRRGKSIAGIGPVKLAEQGLARSFQLIAIFPQLTVEETIATALISRQRKRWHLFSRLAADATIRSRAHEVARIFGLDRRLDAAAAALSQGEKKLLDVASAFALDPEVILLDEPTSGVSTGDKHEIMGILIAAGRKAGVKAIVLVEHDMDLVAAYSSRIIALSGGKVLADLPPDRFFADAALVDAVVGRRRAH